MSRFFLVLISAMMVSAAFAGCFGEDDDGDNDPDVNNPPPGTGNNNTTEPGTNNTTEEPKVTIAPTPAFTVSFAIVDDEGAETSNETGTNFTATPGENVEFTFDGTPSTDDDGSIEAYSWQVITPDGVEYKASGPVLWFNISDIKSSHFGVFKGTLKVLDDDNVLNSAEFFIVLDYAAVFSAPGGMTGPGTAACGDPNEDSAGSDAGTGVTPGTYGIHRVTVGENASSLDVTLTFSSDALGLTSMGLYIIGPDLDETDCANAVATADAAASPVSASAQDLEPGAYWIRAELDGAQVASYEIEVMLTYSPPTQTTEDAAEPPAEEE